MSVCHGSSYSKRWERGRREGGAKPDEIKHLQNNFYQSSLAKNKVLYLLIYFINLTEASLHELTWVEGTRHSHKAKHRHIILSSEDRDSDGLNLPPKWKPREMSSVVFFKVLSLKVMTTVRFHLFFFRKGIIAANHPHVLNYQLSNHWTVVTTAGHFFISVHVIRAGSRLPIQR